MVASFQVPAFSGSGGISRGHRSSGRKELFCAFGIDVDAVAGWLGSYGGEDSPCDISRGLFSGEVGEQAQESRVPAVAGQLAKICLGAGRRAGAMIGHTQPRRIAARSVAARIASELGTGLGRLVGYQVRFRRHTAPDTRIKLMTDGILLAEIQGDRNLRAYDTLIIDEAHERTLNVDFVLGYLHGLVRRRPDLGVVVASATLEVDKLRAFFDEAPVVEVEGRTHPIEIRALRTKRRSRHRIRTASTTIILEKGNFTTIGCVLDCSGISGNPSTEYSGQITRCSHEIKRETTRRLERHRSGLHC